MARFLYGLNEEIFGFVEMFPYHTLQYLVDQAMHTERKIQQQARGRSYASHSIAAPWRKQQPSTSFVGGSSQGGAARPSPSVGAAKTTVSLVSSPTIQQEQRHPVTSIVAPSIASAGASFSQSRGIVYHKCQGHSHVVAQCPSRKTMIVNELGAWESQSDKEEEGIQEETLSNAVSDIQPDEGDNNCLISL